METLGQNGEQLGLEFGDNKNRLIGSDLIAIEERLDRLYAEKMDTAVGDRAFNIDKEIERYEKLKAELLERQKNN